MKTKLLRKLRKQFAWKCVKKDCGGVMMDQWILLNSVQHIITTHSSTERLLYIMLDYNAEYGVTYWKKLRRTHVGRMRKREFNQIGQKQ